MRSLVRKGKMLDIELSLNNQILEKVCSYKYLGLILDEHLNYNKHIKEMSKLISHKLYLMSKLYEEFRKLQKRTLTALYT